MNKKTINGNGIFIHTLSKMRAYCSMFYNFNTFKAVFGSCKSIFEKYSIFWKCYFPERKMFSYVWLHFKKIFEKYFLVFGKE